MPYRDDEPHHHRAKLADLVEYYDAAKASAVKAGRRLRRTRQQADERAVARTRADLRRALGLLLWTVVLAGWGGGLVAWSEALLHRTSEAPVPVVDPYCAEQIEYERAVCGEAVAREADTQRGICDGFNREIQHALHAYQARAQQMPACFPFIPSRGDPNVITETLPSGTIITYTRNEAPRDVLTDDCEARLRHAEDIAGRWYDIYVTTARFGSPSRGQRAWIENRMHMEVEVSE